MNNKLTDLNNYLFEQLERINDDELTGEKLQEELIKASAITGIANQIINNGKLLLDAAKFQDKRDREDSTIPRMLSGE